MNCGQVRRVRSLMRPAALTQSRQLQTTKTLQNSGFFGTFFERKVEQQQQSHSNQFARKERIVEIHSHSVKPDSIDKYLKNQETFQGIQLFLIKQFAMSQTLQGSWTLTKMYYMESVWETSACWLETKTSLFIFGGREVVVVGRFTITNITYQIWRRIPEHWREPQIPWEQQRL